MDECVSIVIVNYNGKNFIEGLLSSLSDQSIQNFEVIFVDNASTDNSAKILKKLLKEKFSNLKVKIILNKKNLGYCAGNNVGLKYAKGNYVVFLNNDTYLHPNWLNELVKVLNEHPLIGACQSKLLSLTTADVQNVGNVCDKYGLSTWGPRPRECNQNNLLVNTFFYPSGASFIIRNKIIDE